MKILIISNFFPASFPGGYERLCGQVCSVLKKKGHSVKVLTSKYTGLESDKKDKSYINRSLELCLPYNELENTKMTKKLHVGKNNYQITKSVIAKEAPSVIFFWSLLGLTLGSARAASDSKIPVVYAFNDEYISGFLPTTLNFKPRQFFNYALDNWLYPDNTVRGLEFPHTTCISKSLKNNLLKKGLKIQNSKVIHQGISINDFPLKSDPIYSNNPIKILYIGGLYRHKGVHNIIDAVYILKRNYPKIELEVSIAGEGSEEYTKELKLKCLKLNDSVTFLKKVPHEKLSSLYRNHDMFVFPSLWEETIDLTHIEAMASGTPVISTFSGRDEEELLKSELNSLTYTKDDAFGLAMQIKRLAESKNLSSRIVKNARKTVEDKFTIKRYVNDLELLLLNASL